MVLFTGVTYILSSSLRPEDQKWLSAYLKENGATESSLEDATHIISDTLEFEGWQSAPENAEVVIPKWVERSVTLGKRQLTKYYSPDPSMLFSGVCATATDIDHSDVEVLSGAIVALGGQWRKGLTREITHLFSMGNTSEKYLTAMHYQKETRAKIIVPHWFDDVVRFGAATLPTLPYEWPNPKVLQLNPPSPRGKRSYKLPEEKASLYKSVVLGACEDTEIPGNLGKTAERIDVWKGKRILLSLTLGLSPGRRKAVAAGVKRFGGVIVAVESESEETKKVEDVDVLVTKFRAGAAYFKAVKRNGVVVGSLSWLFHVQTIRAISPPTDRLLHYPTPSEKIEGFDKHAITVTNYTGEPREYLKRLIETMGARFTPSMSTENTVVVAAYISGKKTDRATQWSIPTVNHTWLEDCFVNWKNLSVGQEKYVRFSPACDCSGFLGDKGIGRQVILDDAGRDTPTQEPVPTGSIVEVEEAIAVDENDNGTNSEHPPVKDEANDVEMVDDDALDSATDAKGGVSPKRERTASPSPTPRKRRRSGDAKPNIAEETNLKTPKKSAITGRRTFSQVEVVIPLRSDHASLRSGDATSKLRGSTSHKLIASESPVSSKRSSPAKRRASGRKSVLAAEEVEEEEEGPAFTKRVLPKRTPKRKRDKTESEEEEEQPTPGPSKPKPALTKGARRPAQEPSQASPRSKDAPVRGRRSAAQKADEKLKDIMPDVINFEKQMKRGVVVGNWEKAAKEREKVEKAKEKEREKEKSKENTGGKVKETAKRRRSDVSSREEEEEDSDGPPASKRAGTDIRIMTTKVQISEDTRKVLTKLGAIFTEKPLECTHLIAGAFGRTEKLLSTIAVAPFILRDEWLAKSAAKGRFLPEKDYALEDRETEAKYAFKMSKTLERAKKNKGKLLEGKTFYLTQKVDVDKKLMKNIVAAHGGTLVVQTPTHRMITSKPDRYVISCEEDGSIWRAIAENDVPVYTKELILTGILKQEIAWDDQGFMVPGSY